MNKILSLLKRFGLWLATIFGAIIVLFIYNPIKFVISIIAKIVLLIIKLGEFIVSLFNKKQKETSKNTESFGYKFKKFLISLSAIKHYKGKNSYLKNLDNKVTGSRGSLLYVEIITFILLVLFFAPFALIILNTTKTANQIVENPLAFSGSFDVFWSNLTNILTSDRMRYWNSFFNSLIITSGSLLAIGVFAAMAAWVLVRTKKRYSKFIFLLFLSGMVIPFQVVMLPLVRLLELISVNLGINMKDTYHGIILVYIGFGAPLSVFMFHGFIKSIPMDIEEAAIIDGCTRPQLFFRIIIPILKPIFVTLLVLNGLWIWNDYLLPSLVIGITGEVRTLPLAVANLAGAYVRQWDLLLTSVLLAAIPVIILFLFAQKFIIKGMTSGAIK